jgi:thiamine biosynthesis lipoprotein
MIGVPSQEGAWRVTLEDPLDEAHGLAVLKIPPGAVATSAVTKRTWLQAGQQRHHLIDPRTQLPAETEWLSMTVLAPHAAEAEVYAKSLLLGGSREISRVAALNPQIELIVVDRNKKIWGSSDSQRIFEV